MQTVNRFTHLVWPNRLSIARLRLRAWFITHIMEGWILKSRIERFYLTLGGHIFFQTLRAGVDVELFALLARKGPLSVTEIQSALNVDEKPVRILLLGLRVLGLIRERQGRYLPSWLAQYLLSPDSPKNVISIVQWQARINYLPMQRFTDAILSNRNLGLDCFEGNEPTLYERLRRYPDLEQVFHDAMHAISVQANEFLPALLEFCQARHVVDIGGGDGSNAIALARMHPRLRVTVFDNASVCDLARANIAAAGLSDRIGIHTGNCFDDPLPRDADCFLLAHFCTIWSEERNVELLKKCYEYVKPGGSVVIFNMMQSDKGSGPVSAAFGSPYFLTLATGEGMLYQRSSYLQWMKNAGFKSVSITSLPRDHGVVRGSKPLVHQLAS